MTADARCGIGASPMTKGQRWAVVSLAAVAAATVVALYLPAVPLDLVGDDYQWVQHAHRALHRPALLFADMDGFFRPAGTWTLVVDRLLWPWEPAGYHLTSLLLHLTAAALLGLAAARLGVPPLGAVAVAGVWGVSPWASESALHPAVRFDTLLLAAWGALIAVWPRPQERWTVGRRAGAVGALLLAMASKETWVVSPGLVLALELLQRRRQGLAAWVPAAVVTAAVLAYTAAHVTLLSLGRTYFALEPGIAAKLPQQLAAFFLLAPHRPAGFQFTPAGGTAVVLVAALAWWAWRRRSAAMGVGLALLLLPTLPTLATPVLPLRYTAASFAGLVVAGAGLAADVLSCLSLRWRRGGVAVAMVATLAVGAWGAWRVSLELEDARRVAEAHARLLHHAGRIAPLVPVGVPVVVLSREEVSPLAGIAAAPAGWPKPFFVRGHDPAGLVDSAALLAWSLRDETLDVIHLGDWNAGAARRPGRVLLYSSAGFQWMEGWIADAGAFAAGLRAAGKAVRLVEVQHVQRR